MDRASASQTFYRNQLPFSTTNPTLFLFHDCLSLSMCDKINSLIHPQSTDHCFALQVSEGQCAPKWTCRWWENLLYWWRFVPNEPVHEQVWMNQLRFLMRGKLRVRRRWREGSNRGEVRAHLHTRVKARDRSKEALMWIRSLPNSGSLLSEGLSIYSTFARCCSSCLWSLQFRETSLRENFASAWCIVWVK